jgi:peptidoglycan/LPS O-acetylase OafA/YrhL
VKYRQIPAAAIALGWTLPLINRNTLAVDVFIVLSGFVIAGLIDRRNEAYLPYTIVISSGEISS